MKIKLLFDEDLDNNILRGVLRRLPDLDFRRVQDFDRVSVADADVLQWAASEQRVTITHDVRTMIPAAIQRIEAGQDMPGLVVVPQLLRVGDAINDLVLFAECSLDGEWANQIIWLPL